MNGPPPAPESGEAALEMLVSQALGPSTLAQVSDILPTLLRDLTDIDWRLSEALGARYAPLTEAARYASSTGGKRVRPLLMLAMYRALGAPSGQPIHALAAAFQLIHTATLVHDDVIDHANLRRGRPSMPHAYGIPMSIVTGDYLFVRAFELAAEYPRSIILRCGEACADLVEGEVLQDGGRFDLSLGREQYLRIIERKTASIIVAGLASSAELAGAPGSTVDAAASYGRALGISFQIRDDLLDVYGDPDLLGKPLYADFREGNPTLLATETYARLGPKDQAEFEHLFQLRNKRAKHLIRLRELASQAGADVLVAEEARRWSERAVSALGPVPPGPYRLLLERTARGVVDRRF